MIELGVQGTDVAEVRFAISPLFEVYCSVLALDDPSARVLHLPWIAATRELADEDDLNLLRALQPSGVYTPDFVHPPPASPLASLDDELSVMLETSPDQVRFEIRGAYGRSVPARLQQFIDTPDEALSNLADVIRNYWRQVLAPHWQRIRNLLEGDVLYRSRQFADGGVRRLLSDIHDQLRFTDGAVTIDKPVDLRHDLNGEGLVLVPSAFIWPRLGALVQGPWQPTLMYPARGIGTLWERGRDNSAPALAALVGGRRARILLDLDAPRSTRELALRLRLSPPSVSQHLAVLRDAGLVHPRRVGHSVLYARTPGGDDLARAST